jgi:hypothetical protein
MLYGERKQILISIHYDKRTALIHMVNKMEIVKCHVEVTGMVRVRFWTDSDPIQSARKGMLRFCSW